MTQALVEARAARDAADKVLRAEAQNAIRDELKKAFVTNPNQWIVWGQKSGEYNDEGMYPGVHGPMWVDVDSDFYDYRYDISYGEAQCPPELKSLYDVLHLLGDEILTDIFGEEEVCTASLEDGVVTIESEYGGC